MFDPINVFAVAWGVMFVVRPLSIVLRDDYEFFGVDIRPTLGRAVLLGLLGAVGFILGYESKAGAWLAGRFPAPPERVSRRAAMGLATVVAAAGVALLVLLLLRADGADSIAVFLRGRSPELDAIIQRSTIYLWWGSLIVVPAALVAFALAYVARTLSAILLALAVVALALLRTVPTGNRMVLLVLVGGAIVLVYLRRSRRPSVAAVVIGFAAAAIVSWAVLNFRYEETRGGATGWLEGLPSLSQLASPVTEGADAEMAPALAGALTVVPSRLSYRFGGATLGDLVTRPIPRNLWKGKPETPGHEVVDAVWPVARERGSFDPAFTPLLFFFWDFGLVGAAVGMGLYGILARGLYEFFRRHPANLLAQLIFASGLMYVVVAVRFDPVLTLVQWIVLIGPLALIFALAARGHAR